MKNRNIVIIIALLLLLTLSQNQSTPIAGTTYSSAPVGSKAVYLALEQLERPVTRWYQPFGDLSQGEQKQVLISINPNDFGAEEKLLSWVRNGNRLILFQGSTSALDKIFEMLGIKTTLPEVDKIKFGSKDPRRQPLNCRNVSNNSPLCNGQLYVTEPESIQYMVAPKTSKVLLKVGSHDSIFQIPLGKGDIWIFSAATPISNEFIDKFDNFSVIYLLTAEAKKILFDEFHHGFTLPLTDAQQNIWNSIILFATCLTLLLIFAAMSRAVRFGPPTKPSETPSSASLDFVKVLGVLYQERNFSSVLTLYLATWRQRLARTHRISTSLSNRQLLAEMIYQGKIDSDKAAQLEDALILIEGNSAESTGANSNKAATKKELEHAISVLELMLKNTQSNKANTNDAKSLAINL